MNFWGPFLPIIFEEFSDQINTIFRDKQSFIKRAVEGLQKYQYLMFIYHKYITSVFFIPYNYDLFWNFALRFGSI